MARKSEAIDVFLANNRKAIANALIDDEIKELLLPYTYDEARLNEGMSLYKEADALYEKQQMDYVIQYKAKEKFDKAFNDAHDVYIEHISLTRLALDDEPSERTMLSLDGKRSQTLAIWLRHANRFYNNTIDNEEMLNKIARYGITNEKLKEAKELIKTLELVDDEHDRGKGAAQKSTNKRNKAFRKLDKWMSEYIKVCRFALKEKPQLLEKLGIIVLSEGYVRKSKKKENEEQGEGVEVVGAVSTEGEEAKSS